MGSCRGVVRLLVGTLMFFSIIWVLVAGVLESRVAGKVKPKFSSTETLMHWRLMGRDRDSHVSRRHHGLNIVSKRRVPNGPDPIHNRREVKSRVPPSRA